MLNGLFGNGGNSNSNQQQQPAQQPGQQQEPQQQQQPAPNTPTASESPMSEYADLWETPNQQQEQQQQQQPQQPQGNELTLEGINKSLQNVNFMQSVDPAMVQTALAGGEDAPQALMNLLNQTARQAMSYSMVASNKLATRGMDTAMESFRNDLPGQLRQHLSQAELGNDPILSNPALAPVADSIRQQVMLKHPNATPQQVTETVNNYLRGVSDLYASDSGQQGQQPQSQSPEEQDWAALLLGNPQQ